MYSFKSPVGVVELLDKLATISQSNLNVGYWLGGVKGYRGSGLSLVGNLVLLWWGWSWNQLWSSTRRNRRGKIKINISSFSTYVGCSCGWGWTGKQSSAINIMIYVPPTPNSIVKIPESVVALYNHRYKERGDETVTFIYFRKNVKRRLQGLAEKCSWLMNIFHISPSFQYHVDYSTVKCGKNIWLFKL